MNPLEAAFLVALVVLPFHVLVQWQLRLLCDPRYLRKRGVVIRREEIVGRSEKVIGRYRGCDIYSSLIFMGMEYRFERVVSPAYRVKARELLLPPGLLYVTD